MNKISLRILDIIVICGGVFLLQWHGIRFWIHAVDVETGIWWSILIEFVNFWAWFQVREIRWRWFLIRFIAICTTGLLLVGPIYIVSLEIIVEVSKISNVSGEFDRKKNLLEEELQQKKEQSDRLLKIIENTEDGWITFNKLNDRMQKIVIELGSMEKPETDSAVPLQRILIVLLQIFSVLIFQLAVILSITKIGGAGIENLEVKSYSDLMRRRQENEEDNTSR